jgi:hypothetical protein
VSPPARLSGLLKTSPADQYQALKKVVNDATGIEIGDGRFLTISR